MDGIQWFLEHSNPVATTAIGVLLLGSFVRSNFKDDLNIFLYKKSANFREVAKLSTELKEQSDKHIKEQIKREIYRKTFGIRLSPKNLTILSNHHTFSRIDLREIKKIQDILVFQDNGVKVGNYNTPFQWIPNLFFFFLCIVGCYIVYYISSYKGLWAAVIDFIGFVAFLAGFVGLFNQYEKFYFHKKYKTILV